MHDSNDPITEPSSNDQKSKITKLCGEVSILRANILALEKENYGLKQERSKVMLGELSKLDKMKKAVKILQTENKIKENQLRAFKRAKPGFDINWAAEALNQDQICVHPFDYTRLKKLHDYFYEDFVKISESETLVEICKIREQKCFIDFFVLFLGFRTVFNEFIFDIFTQNEEFENKKLFKILKYCHLDWLTVFFERQRFVDAISDFLDMNLNDKNSILFCIRVAENRPFLLTFVLSKKMFTKMLENSNRFVDELVRIMGSKKIVNYVDYENVHLVKNEHLKLFFDQEFVDLG